MTRRVMQVRSSEVDGMRPAVGRQRDDAEETEALEADVQPVGGVSVGAALADPDGGLEQLAFSFAMSC